MMIKFLARGTGSAAAAAERSPKFCAGCKRDLIEAAADAGAAARAGAGFWPQPLV